MGIMITIFVVIIIITIVFITIIGFGAKGRSEFSGTVSHPQVQTLSNRCPTSNSHGSRPRPQGGRARGEPTPHGTTGGEGGYHGVGGEGGPSSAAPYIVESRAFRPVRL